MLGRWYPVIFPIAFAVISVIVKLLSRRNDDDSPHRNDCYIGQSLVLGSLSASLVYLIRAILANKDWLALETIVLSGGLLLLMLVLAYLDRYFAWEEAPPPLSGYQRELVWGIMVPNVTGMMAFFTVFIFSKLRGL